MARGLLIVHCVPRALAPHIEWAIAGVIGVPLKVKWEKQPIEPTLLRTEIAWHITSGTGAQLATALRGWDELRFEIIQYPSAREDGSRWMYTPELGIHHSNMDASGNITLTEDRIKSCIESCKSDPSQIPFELGIALGKPWDDELEIYREAVLTASVPRRLSLVS